MTPHHLSDEAQEIHSHLRLRVADAVVGLEQLHRVGIGSPGAEQPLATVNPAGNVHGSSSCSPIAGISFHELNTCATPWRANTAPWASVKSSGFRSSTA